MGRPPVLPKKKKDGFYLELRNKGAKTGIIVIRDTKEAMMQAARQYENTKDVIILGEHKKGKNFQEYPVYQGIWTRSVTGQYNFYRTLFRNKILCYHSLFFMKIEMMD